MKEEELVSSLVDKVFVSRIAHVLIVAKLATWVLQFQASYEM